ncbi:endonuclease/exonuclease/phosphatase family protein [Candidatus Dojkabacteria bacterium]|nr:endonuclease/exonuclease/phosphatase family protein [Candidatus Dojkabacteria bacterium]
MILLSNIILGIIYEYDKRNMLVTSLSESDVIKIMTYNIYHGNKLTNTEHRNKIKVIAKYIKDNQIEIAGLQEVSTLPDPDISIVLEEELKAINYPMYQAVPETIIEGYIKSIVISKYPIVGKEFVKQNPCVKGVCKRWVNITQIDSPLGLIRFINTHINYENNNCESFKQFNEIIESYQSDPSTIIVGDFNMEHHGNGCDLKIADVYQNNCVDTKNCIIKDGVIDWILLPKSGSSFEQLKRIQDRNMTASDHFPVIAELRLTGVLVTPTIIPTASQTISITPTITPQLSDYPIDLDENGNIGIEDFMKFVEFYKTSNCIIDFNKDSKCKDIEDFKIFVNEYKNK